MPIVASTAPTRTRHNRFEVIEVSFTAAAMTVVVAIADENSVVVARQPLSHSGARWQSLSYLPNGDAQVTTTDAPGGSLALDFNAFANTAGGWAPRAAALEARMQSTGRIPA